MAVDDGLAPDGEGQTPLDADDLDGLIPTYITTRGELNSAEQANIAAALRRPLPTDPEQVLDHLYLRRLHSAMFGEVWAWAGTYRLRSVNIGVEPAAVPTAVAELCENARWWIRDAADLDLEVARFHHRLVAIHPFRNGNGRHARWAADLLQLTLGGQQFSWGSRTGFTTTELRARYVTALRRADRDPDDLEDLVRFARG